MLFTVAILLCAVRDEQCKTSESPNLANLGEIFFGTISNVIYK